MSIIRELIPQKSENDFSQLLPAILSIWNDTKNLKYLTFTLIPFSEEQFRQWLEHHLDNGIRFFAEVDESENILGISVLKIDQVMGFELFGLAVRPESQNQGIGKRLADHTVSLAKSLQYNSIEVSVFADNPRMLRLMIANGFVPIKMQHHMRSDGGDIVILRKHLS
jgi:ribosomal protein S18 acetylase RimI-like enzyme